MDYEKRVVTLQKRVSVCVWDRNHSCHFFPCIIKIVEHWNYCDGCERRRRLTKQASGLTGVVVSPHRHLKKMSHGILNAAQNTTARYGLQETRQLLYCYASFLLLFIIGSKCFRWADFPNNSSFKPVKFSNCAYSSCILFLCWIKTGRGARFPKCKSRERLYNIDLQHEEGQWVSAESYVIRFDDSAAFTLESSSIQTCENLDNHLQSFTQWSNQHHTGYLASLCF